MMVNNETDFHKSVDYIRKWCIDVFDPSYLEWTTNNKKSKPLIKL